MGKTTAVIFLIAFFCMFTRNTIVFSKEDIQSNKKTIVPLSEDFTYDSKGKRDPFTPPVKADSDLTLDGIVSDADGIFAVVSGQVVKTGDKVFGADVISITKDVVVLQRKSEKIELKMPKIENNTQNKEE